ncbi:MAG: mechanosensitive ion channel family protein [Rubricoccaceae bacterium]
MQLADSLQAALEGVTEAASETAGTIADPVFWLGLATRFVRVGLVVLMALVVLAVAQRLKKRWVARAMRETVRLKKRQRVLTVADLLGSVMRYAVWTVAVIAILSELEFDVAPLIAGAGIAGLAIGFGAQTLVRDVISGVFLLFDDTLASGDLITFQNQTGTVEYVGLRLIKVRKFDGELLMIPAGELRTFGNKSVGFARAIVEVGLSYEQDLAEELAALEAVAEAWAQTEHARAAMLEEKPSVQGVMALADSAVTARIVVQVRPGEQFQAERDLRRMVKEFFDARGLEIPFPRRTVYMRTEDGPARSGAAAPEGPEPPTADEARPEARPEPPPGEAPSADEALRRAPNWLPGERPSGEAPEGGGQSPRAPGASG